MSLEEAREKATELVSDSEQVVGVVLKGEAMQGFNVGKSTDHHGILIIQTLHHLADEMTRRLSGKLGEEEFQKLYDKVAEHTERKVIVDNTKMGKSE